MLCDFASAFEHYWVELAMAFLCLLYRNILLSYVWHLDWCFAWAFYERAVVQYIHGLMK